MKIIMSFYLGHPVLVTPIMSAALAAGKRATSIYYVVKTYPADGKNVDQKTLTNRKNEP